MSIRSNDLNPYSNYDLVKFYTHFFNPLNFYEYLLQKNIDFYEEGIKHIEIRENPALFKIAALAALNEANTQYSKHGLKEIFKPDQKKTQELNNRIIDQFEDIKEVMGEDDPFTINTKKELELLLKHNDITDSYVDELTVFNKEIGYK